MPATIAISSASAGAAMIAAHNAEEAACKATMAAYNPTTATVEQKRDYADCVRTVYGTGQPMTGSEIIMLKVLIVLVLLGGVVGAVRGWMDDEAIGSILLGILGMASAFGLALVLFLVVTMVSFLFGGTP